MWSDPAAANCTSCGTGIFSEPRDIDEHPTAAIGALVRSQPTSCCECVCALVCATVAATPDMAARRVRMPARECKSRAQRRHLDVPVGAGSASACPPTTHTHAHWPCVFTHHRALLLPRSLTCMQTSSRAWA
jgi:hypothetical protein